MRITISPAILSYEGIQYHCMAPDVMEAAHLDYLQEHLRILSLASSRLICRQEASFSPPPHTAGSKRTSRTGMIRLIGAPPKVRLCFIVCPGIRQHSRHALVRSGGSGILDYMLLKSVAEIFHCKKYLEKWMMYAFPSAFQIK